MEYYIEAIFMHGVLNLMPVCNKSSFFLQSNNCPQYELSYEVRLSGSEIIYFDPTNCSERKCVFLFTNISMEIEKFKLTLRARNKFNSSGLTVFPQTIGKSITIIYLIS